MGTSKIIIQVPLFHLKFLDGICRLRCRNFKWAAPILAAVMWTACASAQVSLAPPEQHRTSRSKPPCRKTKVRPAAKKPHTARTATRPRDYADTRPPPDDPNADLVYGAYQRGFYKTAFDLAIKRAQENGDPKAMTMLGELYANGFGLKRDDAKAVAWYKRGADAGDREAMFELAMLRLAGRGGPVESRGGGKIAGVLGQARQFQGDLQSRFAVSRRG